MHFAKGLYNVKVECFIRVGQTLAAIKTARTYRVNEAGAFDRDCPDKAVRIRPLYADDGETLDSVLSGKEERLNHASQQHESIVG